MICAAVYPEALYVIEGLFEAIVCLILVIFARGITVYIRKWEMHEYEKYMPKKYNLSDY